MLTFPTNLKNVLTDENTRVFFYIKLYYGDESSFTPLSGIDRVIDNVQYYPLIDRWDDLQQSVDLFNFTPSVASMTITINNAPDQIDGERFSDLFASQNYVNRKWELFLGDHSLAVADHAQIGEGVIADDIRQTKDAVTMRLLDYEALKDFEIPASRVTDTYPLAPTENKNQPVPIMYGDMDVMADASGNHDFDRHEVRGHSPAIIINPQDDDGFVQALPDTNQGSSVILNQLRARNVFLSETGEFLPCLHTNVKVGNAAAGNDDAPTTTAENIVYASNQNWKGLFRITSVAAESGTITNSDKMIDGDWDTAGTISAAENSGSYIDFDFPPLPNSGDIVSTQAMDLVLQIDSVTATSPGGDFYFEVNNGVNETNRSISWATGTQTIQFAAGEFNDNELRGKDFSGQTLRLVLDNTPTGGAVVSANIAKLEWQIAFRPSRDYQYKGWWDRQRIDVEGDSTRRDSFRTRNIHRARLAPTGIRYLYIGGKGREFDSWIDADSRTNGYNDTDLMENPIYMAEDVLRTEGGLTSSNIDYTTFDEAGNTTDGLIKKVFDMGSANPTVEGTDIKFAGCVRDFEGGFSFLRNLGAQCGAIFFWSGSGKVKVSVLQRDEDYTSSDLTLRYKDLSSIQPSQTKVRDARNRITVNYKRDYAADKFLAVTYEADDPDANDTTSQDDGITGINATQELVRDADFIRDETTAQNLNAYLLDWLAYRRLTLSFECTHPRYLELEICDTIEFENWPSDFKIYGNAVTSTDIFMITKISKRESGCSIKCMKVSDIGD